MKVLGLCLLIAAGGGIGAWQAAALKKRAAVWGECHRFVLWISQQMRYTAAPLDSLLQQAGREFSPSFFLLLQEVMHESKDKEESPSYVKQYNFTEEEKGVIRRFAQRLGQTDIEGQLQHSEYYEKILEERYQKAQRTAQERGHVIRTMWLGGVAILALLLW